MAGRARVDIVEVDLSARVPSFPGVYGAMVLDLKKGEVLTPTLNTSEDNFFKKHTLNGKINPGDSLGLFEARTFLQKSNKLWTVRPDTGATYGGAWLSQDVPYHQLSVSVNQGISMLLLRYTTEEDKAKAEIMYPALSDGDIIRLQVAGGELPQPLQADTPYYIIKKNADKFGLQVAQSLEDALNGVYIVFQSAATGPIQINISSDKVNGEQEYEVVNPEAYDLTTSDGRPAGYTSTFHVDMEGDFITVTKAFFDTVVTGDEVTLLGQQEDIPEVDSGLPLNVGDSVYVIKVPMEGENADKFKVQLARTQQDSFSENYIGFQTKGKVGFKLQLVMKTNVTDATIDIDQDALTVDSKFFACLEDNDKLQLESADTYPTTSYGSLDISSIYYAIKGQDNTLHIALEKSGTPIDFLTEGVNCKFVNTSKARETTTQIDLSKDALSVDEVFYETVETGFKVQVTSDGVLPSGLESGRDYWVIKTSTEQVIKLATTEGNAINNIPVDIIDSGTLDNTQNQYHHILDVHNSVLTGFNQKCGYIHTSTPCEEEIYYKLIHYPYGSEEEWSDTDKAAAETVKEPGAFKLWLYKQNTAGEMEEYESYIMSRNPAHLDGYGQNIYCEEVAKQSNLIRWIDNKAVDPNVYPTNQTSYAKLTGGTSGATVTTGMAITALKTLSNKRRFPVTLVMDAGRSVPSYQQAIIDLCESRGSTFGILSTPISMEQSNNYLEDIVNYKTRQLITSTSYAALYSPHVLIYDEYNDREIYVSPTGHVGGCISQTAANYEPWYAPAGNRRGVLNVLGLSREFNTGDMDYLYDNNINPIEFHETKGIRIWGQKTLLTRPSALDRVNVRMLLVVIEPAIEEFLEDFVFEINDSLTRQLIVDGLTPYMESIQRRRGVYAFKIQCDDENNTAEVIDANELICDVYIQPVKVAEYIKGRIIITRTGASFSL